MPIKSKQLIRGELALEEYQEYFLTTKLLSGFSRKTSIAWLMETGGVGEHVFKSMVPREVEMSGNLLRIKTIEDVLRKLERNSHKQWRAVMLDRVYAPDSLKSADKKAALLGVGDRWYYKLVEGGLKFLGSEL